MLYEVITDAYLRDIYERLLFTRAWNGILTLQGADGSPQVCLARVRAYDRDGGNHLWFSLSPRQTGRDADLPPPAPPAPGLAAHLAAAEDVRAMLLALLDRNNFV